MIGRLIILALGALLFVMAALCASVAPDVLQRAAELEPIHGRVGFAAYAVAVLGGLIMGAGFMAAAVIGKRRK